MNNQPPEMPPIDFDDLVVPDDPFRDDMFAGDEYRYAPTLAEDPFGFDAADWLSDDAFVSVQPESHGQSSDTSVTTPTPDDGWSWVEARLIGVERDNDDGMQYEIGCMDVYADLKTGDLGANYLPIAHFGDIDVATAFYHDLQGNLHDHAIPTSETPKFAEDAARRFNVAPAVWQGATPKEYAAYEAMRNLDTPDRGLVDDPPKQTVETLVHTAAELGGVEVEPEMKADIEDRAAFQALSAIGIDVEDFQPEKDPPPFYDEETGTAYWIGVFQPDEADRENCITSILSLGRNTETGEIEALLAPCVPGDWDKTYDAAEFLIDVAQRNGIDGCFNAVEGMALATEQRELWETPLGLPLEPDTANEIADYTRDNWEMDL